MQLEQAFHILGSLCKVHEDVAFVFVFCKFLNNSGLTDSAGTFYKKGFPAAGFLLPCKEFTVNFSFEKHDYRLRP